MSLATYAQQLPDPGFEDWSGTQFDGNAQPKYWNFSNVSQMGVDKNFAHQTTGRSGKALKIQDQFVGVMGIGATSPGYVALGHPWAYVSSLTTIEDATAGTYGGISWTYRPDSMVVWIKRYYDSSVDNAAGNHINEENFNLLFYSWSGTSKGKSYKAKNLTCTDLSSAAPTYCVDEESDIRQATNGNECETSVQAKQIAEGWIYQKKAYANWTRIVVPIYYLNDDAPQKCNVILSAGNYPNFRANSGQYAGSSLDVDDIQLIYSSKAQKIYVGGREWKTFDPDNTGEQIYSLGLGATEIPEVFAVRGAGAITNVRGKKTTFPGRRLNDSECQIVYGQVDGAPTTVTVTAEDGSSTTTYRIKFVSQASTNARLSDIKVNGESNIAILGHVGDSRCYFLKNHHDLAQISEDQTYVGYLLRTGQITPEEALTHPKRHVLMNALGIYPSASIDIKTFPYLNEEVLLCSDGLYNNVSFDDISAVMKGNDSVEQKVNELIAIGNKNGGSDNIAVVLWEAQS